MGKKWQKWPTEVLGITQIYEGYNGNIKMIELHNQQYTIVCTIYIYIYIYTYTYIYTRIYLYTHTYIYIYTHINTYIYICIYMTCWGVQTSGRVHNCNV